MDKNNIDQQFKDYFRNRDLKPSKKSWNRLDILLDAEEKPKTKRIYPYYRIAAIVIAILVSFIVWDNFKPMSNQVIIAGNDTEDTKITSQGTGSEELPTFTLSEESLVNEDLSKIETDVATVKKTTIKSSRNIRTQVKLTEAVSTTSIVTPETTDKRPEPLAQLVGQEHKLVSDTKSNTNLRIDADKLLANVEQSISQKKNNTAQAKPNIYRPDPKELLLEVEERTSKTFLQRLYTGFQDNTSKIYVTLSNRNLEYK